MANGVIHPVVMGRAAAIIPINTKVTDSEVFATIEKTLMRKPVSKTRSQDDEEEDKQTGDEMDSDHHTLVSSSTFSMNIEETEQEGEASDGEESAASFFSNEASEDDDHYDEEENQEENVQDMEHGDENLERMQILAFERLLNARSEGRSRRHENSNTSRGQERQAGETGANRATVDPVPGGSVAAQESAPDSSSEAVTSLPRREPVETASRELERHKN